MIFRPKHILVIRLSAMGDVAMVVPILKALQLQNEGLKITLLSKPFFEPIFKDLDGISFFGIDVHGRHKGFFGLRKLAKELIALEIDAVADLHNVLRSNILFRFLKRNGILGFQIDKGRAEKRALVKGVFKPLKSSHERYSDVFRKMGFHIHLDSKLFLVKKPLPNSVKLMLNEEPQHQNYFGIAPFAAHKGKEYPLRLLKEVIIGLVPDFKVVLFGGQADKEVLEALAKNMPNCSSMAGKISFSDELALISNLKGMLSMDSGNGHLAANFGIPVITIWGVTHPYAGFTPFLQPDENQLLSDRVQYPLIPTSIYGNKYPPTYLKCLETIAPQQVIEAIKKSTLL